jgi:hypothetical protein
MVACQQIWLHVEYGRGPGLACVCTEPGLTARSICRRQIHIRRVCHPGLWRCAPYSLLDRQLSSTYTQTRRLVDQPADDAYINCSMSAWKGKASNSEIWAQVHTRAAWVVNQGVRIFTGTPSDSHSWESRTPHLIRGLWRVSDETFSEKMVLLSIFHEDYLRCVKI